jgi:hypothetical protein
VLRSPGLGSRVWESGFVKVEGGGFSLRMVRV